MVSLLFNAFGPFLALFGPISEPFESDLNGSRGKTALQLAVEKGSEEVVRMLMRFGARPVEGDGPLPAYTRPLRALEA